MVFGVVRGAVIICLAYIALSVAVDPAQWPAPVVNARFLPWAHQGAVALVSYLPPQYRPKVAPLPGPPAPSAATLMQTPVTGSALEPSVEKTEGSRLRIALAALKLCGA